MNWTNFLQRLALVLLIFIGIAVNNWLVLGPMMRTAINKDTTTIENKQKIDNKFKKVGDVNATVSAYY